MLQERDLIAIAQTGTGKTLAFGLPCLDRLAACDDPKAQMLVLCPTRELAAQIHSVLDPLAHQLRKRTVCLYGGVGINPQIAQLRMKPAIIIATPGRLLDHINQRTVSLQNLKILVLDEADRMLDMGFMPDIKRIMAVLPEERQTLLFSATFPADIRNRVLPLLRNPHHIEITPESTPVEKIDQGVYAVAQTEKARLLVKLLGNPELQSTLVFTRTKYRADKVAKMLKVSGFPAVAIHGDRTQGQRQEALARFRSGKSNVLVATDIAARGIDVKGISHVINYDIPISPEDYVHRIGRTARAQTSGVALTFASPGDEAALRAIEKIIGRKIGHHAWEGAVALVDKSQRSVQRPAQKQNRPSQQNNNRNSSAPQRRDRPPQSAHGGKRGNRPVPTGQSHERGKTFSR